MATLSVQAITAAGASVAYGAATSGGDKVLPSDRTFLHVFNQSGASVRVTIDDTLTPAPVGAVCFNPDASVVVPAASAYFIGPISASRFKGTDGYASISYSATTSILIAALRI